MASITVTPYLFFTQGRCKEAMEFYQSIFGGELTLQNYGDTMPEMAEKIMYADLSGGEITLRATDSTREKFEESFISLSVANSDEEKMQSLFNALAEGGSIQSPIQMEEWGTKLGTLKDKYGTDWLFSIE